MHTSLHPSQKEAKIILALTNFFIHGHSVSLKFLTRPFKLFLEDLASIDPLITDNSLLSYDQALLFTVGCLLAVIRQ